MKNNLFITIFFLIFLAVSCAHHPDVRPMSSGIHKVVIKSVDPYRGQRRAIDQATSYCKSVNKSLLIKNEESSYIGSADEEAYKAGRAVGRVAGILLKGSDDSEEVVNEAIGKGYETIIEFECR